MCTARISVLVFFITTHVASEECDAQVTEKGRLATNHSLTSIEILESKTGQLLQNCCKVSSLVSALSLFQIKKHLLIIQ